jgi:ABC-type Zn2+ transport system substrate-binding protein/surface adhesin
MSYIISLWRGDNIYNPILIYFRAIATAQELILIHFSLDLGYFLANLKAQMPIRTVVRVKTDKSIIIKKPRNAYNNNNNNKNNNHQHHHQHHHHHIPRNLFNEPTTTMIVTP